MAGIWLNTRNIFLYIFLTFQLFRGGESGAYKLKLFLFLNGFGLLAVTKTLFILNEKWLLVRLLLKLEIKVVGFQSCTKIYWRPIILTNAGQTGFSIRNTLFIICVERVETVTRYFLFTNIGFNRNIKGYWINKTAQIWIYIIYT